MMCTAVETAVSASVARSRRLILVRQHRLTVTQTPQSPSTTTTVSLLGEIIEPHEVALSSVSTKIAAHTLI